MRVRPTTTRYTDRSSSTTSRAISQGYCEAAFGSKPPPPKQPQSIVMPRAQTEEMPTMKTTKSSAGDDGGSPGEQAEHQRDAHHDLDDRQQLPDRGHDRRGQQLVGPDRQHAVGGVGQLDGTRDDPDDAGDQSGDEAEPLLHTPNPRRRD